MSLSTQFHGKDTKGRWFGEWVLDKKRNLGCLFMCKKTSREKLTKCRNRKGSLHGQWGHERPGAGLGKTGG